MDGQKYLTEDEVAEMLNISKHKLYLMRREGAGPKFIRLGHRTLRYEIKEVERFLEALNEGGSDE